VKLLLVVTLLLGVSRAAGAQASAAPAPGVKGAAPQAAQAKAPASGAASPAPAEGEGGERRKRAFSWSVPGMVSHVDIAGTIVAQGIPMKLHMVESSWKPPELFDHFGKVFTQAGFYIPPPKHQLVVHGAATLTAMDVERMLVYTVIMRISPDGKTTKVFLGTSNMEQAKSAASQAFVPIYPGARNVLTSDVEVGRTLGFVTSARPEELHAFYRRVLTEKGFQEESPGVYFKDRERIEVLARPSDKDGLSVLILGRIGSQDELIANPHTD
jgi:hypothetical protein